MANPTLLKTPIASGGDKNTIPETTGSTTGLLSQEKGWQQINSLPINAGGIAPSRLDFNGVFNLLSNILFYTQKGWVWEFDETQNYFAGCTVKDTVDGKTYVCIADVNASTTHPSSDTTHWKLSDLATKDDLANYLPLAGGQMTGSGIRKNVTTSSLEIVGSTSNGAGAWLELFGKDHSSYPWTFMMQAGSTSASRLIGKSDGTLTWGGYNILTDANGGYLPLSGGTMTGTLGVTNLTGGGALSAGGYIRLSPKNSAEDGKVTITEFDSDGVGRYLVLDKNGLSIGAASEAMADLGGSAIVAKSLGTTGYIKRADGLIWQWGESTNVATVQFPITFPTACSQVMVTIDHGSSDYSYANVIAKTTSSFTLYNYSSLITQSYIAVGY